MKRISFILGGGYEAIIGRGAFGSLGETVSGAVRGRTAAIVADAGLPRETVGRCEAMLRSSGFEVGTFLLAPGECRKTLGTVETVYGFFYETGLTRTGCVIGLGGGVTGDIAGFAAATYNRGMDLISVPTTLISQTDSAYGGKTGVDFRGGKNLVGCFKHPRAVVCDPELLVTLPKAEISNGMGEVIKYGAVADPGILDAVSPELPDEELIARCVLIKRDLVEADEFDRGERRVLNFGHTFGHAFEEASGYTLPHGQAVAYGMLAAAKLGESLGITRPNVYKRLFEAIERAGLPADHAPLMEDALPGLVNDKKSDGRYIDFVFLEDLGKPVRRKLPLSTLLSR